MNAEGSHGVIIVHENYVSFCFGHKGEFTGSEPLLGHPRQSRKEAVQTILNVFNMNGVTTHECIKA